MHKVIGVNGLTSGSLKLFIINTAVLNIAVLCCLLCLLSKFHQLSLL